MKGNIQCIQVKAECHQANFNGISSEKVDNAAVPNKMSF